MHGPGRLVEAMSFRWWQGRGASITGHHSGLDRRKQKWEGRFFFLKGLKGGYFFFFWGGGSKKTGEKKEILGEVFRG